MGRGDQLKGVAVCAAAIAALAIPCAPAAAEGTAIGAYVPEFSNADPPKPEAVDELAKQIGMRPLLIQTYRQWSQSLIDPTQLGEIWSGGSIPLVTWEPFDYGGERYPLREIAAGKFDDYLRQSADDAAAFGHPILIRFAHEMNGDWYPWGRGVDGNTPEDFVDAWRHVVTVFREQGADQVEWVWAPQIDKDSELPFTDLFPGDRWIDYAGLDGYNAGVRGNWDSFTQIFGPSYDTLVGLTSHPILITETGSSQTGGDKAEWVSSALRREIPKFSRLQGVVFFNDFFNKLDFRIDSSPSALRAFRDGVARPTYDVSRDEFLSGLPREPDPAAEVAPEPPGGDYGQPSLWYRLTQKLHGKYVWYAIGGAVLALILLALAVYGVRRMARTRTADR